MLRAREAAQFLRPRQRRAYQVFEEAKQGHLERECVEELCSREEAREVFENDPETVSAGPRGAARRAPGALGRRAERRGRRVPSTPAPARGTTLQGTPVRARTDRSGGLRQTILRAHRPLYREAGSGGGRAGCCVPPRPPSGLLLSSPCSPGDARCPSEEERRPMPAGGPVDARSHFPPQASEGSRLEGNCNSDSSTRKQ